MNKVKTMASTIAVNTFFDRCAAALVRPYDDDEVSVMETHIDRVYAAAIDRLPPLNTEEELSCVRSGPSEIVRVAA